MQKNIIISVLTMTSVLFAATNEEIIANFKARIQVPNIKVKIISRKKVSKKLDYVTVFLTNGKSSQKISVFTSGEYIFPEVIDVRSGISLKDKMKRETTNKNIAKIYKNESDNNVIKLGDDSSKKTLVMFSDPECPFCKRELANIENELQKYNMKIIFTPVHERSSLEKSFLIYKYAKKAKSDKDKIKIMRKYFSQDVDEKVSDEDVAKIEKLRTKYFQAGINGTPYKVMEKEIMR
jgi:thiol:disulfide interchange protein DsbC